MPDSPKGFKDNTHTQAPRDTRACPPHPTALWPVAHRMRHAHPLLPTAMAFVPYGLVSVQVQVQVAQPGALSAPAALWLFPIPALCYTI
jgi:hypothetical protein